MVKQPKINEGFYIKNTPFILKNKEGESKKLKDIQKVYKSADEDVMKQIKKIEKNKLKIE